MRNPNPNPNPDPHFGDDDPFGLFGLPARMAQNAAQIEHLWKTLAARVHPDRFATASAVEKRLAMQWAARVNDAYRILRDPLTRARCLCERAGIAVDAETGAAIAPEFLMQQIDWRERLDDARGDAAALAALASELAAETTRYSDTVERLLDGDLHTEADPQTAVLRVREWMFLEKLGAEVAAAVGAATLSSNLSPSVGERSLTSPLPLVGESAPGLPKPGAGEGTPPPDRLV